MVLPKQFVPIEVHNNNGDHDFDQDIDTIQFVGCSDVLMVVPCWTHSFLEKRASVRRKSNAEPQLGFSFRAMTANRELIV